MQNEAVQFEKSEKAYERPSERRRAIARRKPTGRSSACPKPRKPTGSSDCLGDVRCSGVGPNLQSASLGASRSLPNSGARVLGRTVWGAPVYSWTRPSQPTHGCCALHSIAASRRCDKCLGAERERG